MPTLRLHPDLDEAGSTHDPNDAGRPRRRPVFWALLAIVVGLVTIGLISAIMAIALVAGGEQSEQATTSGDGDEVVSPALVETTQSTSGLGTTVPADATATTPGPSGQPTPSSGIGPTGLPTTQAAPTTQAIGVAGPTLPVDCSARGLGPWPDQPELPSPVAAKRTAILDAATSCDLERLLALTGPDFVSSFGGGETGSLWTQLEASGEEPMRDLVELLGLPHRRIEGPDATVYYTWPAAFGLDPNEPLSDQDRQQLATLYTDEEIQLFEEFGYVGNRIVIYDGGSWVTFVAGD